MNDDPSMPPLGPPYAEPSDRPPPLRFPVAPPDHWPSTPVVLPSAPPSVAPPRPRWLDDPRHQTAAWGAVAIVFAIIVGALIGASAADNPVSSIALVPQSSTDESSASDSSSSESDPTTTTEQESLSAIVLDIERFVERERGLEFKEHVPVTLASDGEFQRMVLAELAGDRTALLEEQEVLRAMGLIPPDFDLIKEQQSLISAAAAGFYNPRTKALVVRATSVTPFVREVIAHELTHALDDQWFDLHRPGLDSADDESGFAFGGLVEGNARRVENAYVAAMSPADQIEAATEQAALLAQHPELLDLPAVLLTLVDFTYSDGSLFVEDLLATGGQAMLDGAFAAPPTTSEQILDPTRFVAGEGPVAVAAPQADGAASNVGVLGALLLREMLFDSLPSVAQVQRAITGWGGDAYATWVDASGKTCLRDTFVGDTQGDTNELVGAITEWGAAHDAVVDAPAEGPASFTVCA
ncbi:MAG: hypothetical protein QOD92_219 [Acidimicrobiaceae bacterium]|jgi:hypothetical protein